MPTDPSILSENASQRQRLGALATRLTNVGFGRIVDGLWTISVVLAHLAFWDRLNLMQLRKWPQHGPPFDDPSDSLNDVLLDEWLTIPPQQAAELAPPAAQAIDPAVEALDGQVADAILADGSDRLLKRGRHRREHLGQVSAAASRHR